MSTQASMTERAALRTAVRETLKASMWICDDGHQHSRPEHFTMRRLQTEVNRRNPRNQWYSSTIACAVFDLIDSGELVHDVHGTFELRPA